MRERFIFIACILFFIAIAQDSRAQHALNIPTALNPTFLCDFRIEETFLIENDDKAVYLPYDSTLFKYDVWKRPERVERYVDGILVGESKLEYDRVNKYTRITSLLMDTFYVYNDCGLLMEKNISTGSADRSKASFRYIYNYDDQNLIDQVELWDLKSYDEDKIIEKHNYYRNSEGQIDSVYSSKWDSLFNAYHIKLKTINYQPENNGVVEKTFFGVPASPDFYQDSTLISSFDDKGRIIKLIKLVSNNTGFDTAQVLTYTYGLNNRLLYNVESNYVLNKFNDAQLWYYDYDVKQNLIFIYRSTSSDLLNWEKKDRIRFVVRGQYVPMASPASIEIVPNPAVCCADIIFYSDEHDLVQLTIADMTGRVLYQQMERIIPGRNVIPIPLEKFASAPIMSRQLYLVTIAGGTTYSRGTFIKL